jgi:hypothetical protein
MVRWEDATELDTTAWVQEVSHDYKPDEALVNSVGFLLHESDKGVVLTSAWCEGGEQVARREQIPRGMIRKIVRLKV